MQRPLFSSSYSAKLIEQRYRREGSGTSAHDDWQQQQAQRTRTRQWVRKGVTARGEVWGILSDADSDTVVDEHDEERVENEEEGEDGETEKAEGVGSHGREYHDHAVFGGISPRDAAAFSPSSPTTTTTTTTTTDMAAKTYWWISLWFAVTIPVIFWDAGYCFFRPRSMVGGDLHWIWSPYALYQEIDYVYGLRAYQNGEGFTNAQSALNIFENFLNIEYLYLAHVSRTPVATLVGFASAVMTLSKTVLYWAQEYYCGGCSVGHNDFETLLVYWIIPNGLWLLVPSFIVARLGGDIADSLRASSNVQKKIKKQ